MNTDAPQPARRTGLTIWMILSQLLTLGSLAVWLVLAALPILFWDSPKGPDLSGWLVLLALWAYPILPIGMSIAAWVAYARRKNNQAAILAGICFAPALLCIVAMVLMSLTSLMSAPPANF
jgi:hypothetical protein